jgi:uncharacterized repeat protein (TIGR03803 family)
MSVRIFTLKNALLIMTLALSAAAFAQTESTLYTFSETTNFWPNGTLIEDSKGNLYGTSRGGGTYGVGTVFEMSPPAAPGGAWTMKYIYSFVPYGTGGGGWVPVSDLVQDQSGAFYGTTFNGGDPVCSCGAVYKLTPPAVAGGAWTETQLYAFPWDDIHGRLPANAALTLGSHGTLYGVTVQGGTYNAGVIYELQTKNGKKYTESDLYSFGDEGDGNTPNGPIALDSKGNLYGVTMWGGANNVGTVYKYTPPTRTAAATETVLHSFNYSNGDGFQPTGNLTLDAEGDIYGTTTYGGDQYSDGAVYTLQPSGGTYTESVIFEFSRPTGTNPVAGLVWKNATQSLYGTTSFYGTPDTGEGTIYQLNPPATKSGTWTEVTIAFLIYDVIGGYPAGNVTQDPATGTLYGTAQNGGIEGCDLYCGTAWQILNP